MCFSDNLDDCTGLSQIVLPFFSGLYLHTSGILGASPDAIADDFLVEIKCPYTHRESRDLKESYTMRQQPSKRYLVNFDKTQMKWILNTAHPYYHQIQGQLYFPKKELRYFFIWTLNTCALFEICKDHSWIHNIDLLIDFHINNFIPYILDHKFDEWYDD